MQEITIKDKKVEKDAIKREASHLIEKRVICFVTYNHTDSPQIKNDKRLETKHKVRDYCQLARKYKGAARLFCNLKREQKIAVFYQLFTDI